MNRMEAYLARNQADHPAEVEKMRELLERTATSRRAQMEAIADDAEQHGDPVNAPGLAAHLRHALGRTS